MSYPWQSWSSLRNYRASSLPLIMAASTGRSSQGRQQTCNWSQDHSTLVALVTRCVSVLSWMDTLRVDRTLPRCFWFLKMASSMRNWGFLLILFVMWLFTTNQMGLPVTTRLIFSVPMFHAATWRERDLTRREVDWGSCRQRPCSGRGSARKESSTWSLW